MVSDDINKRGRAFKVMMPVPECLKDGKEFLIVGVIVQLWSSQGPGVESDQMDFSVYAGNRQDASDGIVRGICFHDDTVTPKPLSITNHNGLCTAIRVSDGKGFWSHCRGVQNKVSKYGHSSEGVFESIESALTVLGEDSRSIFPGDLGKRDHNI